jgi:alkylhydroperoxidase/carboxymuconolactone decarboxylase family protein YurZ
MQRILPPSKRTLDAMPRTSSKHAREHFESTTGAIPQSVEVLAKHAPGALDGYLAMREFAHREPPDDALDPITRELLFVALDVAVGHVEGAKAHAVAAIDAGATVAALTQSLVITMMVSGIHTWSQWGHEVVTHAELHAARRSKLGSRARRKR